MLYLKVGVIREVIVESQDVFLQVPTIIEGLFCYREDTAFLIGNDSSPSGYIINKGYFSKGIARVIIDLLLFFALLYIVYFYAVDSFKHNVKMITRISLLEKYRIFLMHLKTDTFQDMPEFHWSCIKWLLDKLNFLWWRWWILWSH